VTKKGPIKGKRDTACLTWDSKSDRGLSLKKPVLDAYELVIPNPSNHMEARTTPSGKDKGSPNRLIWGDNLIAMEALLKEDYEGKVDLIYIDPPFGSKADYSHRLNVEGVEIERKAYTDTWAGGIDGYLDMLEPRLKLMKRLLTEKGKIFVHCDWHVNSYIRVLLDEVFGSACFLNEIIWNYGGRGAKAISGQFPRNHDTIFVYGKTEKATLKKLYCERIMTLKEAKSAGHKVDEEGRLFKTAPRGDYTDLSVKGLEKEGRIYRTRSGNIRIKYFLELRGKRFVKKKLIGDVWDDIPDCMHSPVGERTAFTTQKPETLLMRIIEAATDKGALVCDFFSGSGTTGVVSEKLGRRWIICEKEVIGIQVSRNRLIEKTRRPFVIERIKRGQREKALSPYSKRLRLLRPAVKEISEDKVEISIGLEGYSPGKGGKGGKGHEGFPSKKSIKAYRALMEAYKKNFAVLIDYWAVDWNYDNKIFKSQWQTFRGNGKGARIVETEAKGILERGRRTIAVRVVDIFGNEAEEVMEVR
jgi:DNA modification methylase